MTIKQQIHDYIIENQPINCLREIQEALKVRRGTLVSTIDRLKKRQLVYIKESRYYARDR